MKLECTADKLREVVSRAERFTTKQATLPVLQGIFLSAKNSRLTVRATNLEVGIETFIPVKISKEGEAVVPATVFSQFLLNLRTEGGVLLEVVENNLSVKTKQSTTVIKLLPMEDFPTIPFVKGEQEFSASAEGLIKGFRSVWYSASLSTIRPELSSVYVYQQDNKIVFVATDSFRLAEKKIDLKKGENFTSFLIPYKNIPEIIKVLENESEEVKLSFTKNQISFYLPATTITSRCIDGVFPDYKQIIPKEASTESIVLKEDFIQTLKTATLFSDKFNEIHFSVKPEEKTLSLSSKNNDLGEGVYTLPSSGKGEKIEINFNYKYVIDSFQAIFSDSLSLSFNGLTKPLVVRGNNDASFMYLVMPMNK